jgi:hypothetical protein
MMQVTHELVQQVERLVVEPFICNPAARVISSAISATAELLEPEEEVSSSTWKLPHEEVDACFNFLLTQNIVRPGDHIYKRNWCWVGIKELGCHRHFYDHLTWKEMQQIASQA